MRYLNFASGTTVTTGPQRERLAVALDVSYSMDEDDWKPTRLEAAKEATVALIERKRRIAPEDEVAIVTYAGTGRIICPPVPVGTEADLLYQALGEARLDGCTSLTAGLTASKRALDGKAKANLLDRLLPLDEAAADTPPRRIILLTDGHNNTGRSPRSTSTKLKNAGVCIDCIGIGGEPSDVDEDLLKFIASVGPDGVTPRYAFIGDKSDLIEKFEQLAGRITR